MKKTSKALLLMLCAVLLVAASVLGTMAYLTSTDTVTNTFTVGNVKITLDEQDVDDDDNKTDNVTVNNVVRDKANAYHLLPGHEYTKDPIIHVDADSEDCYVFVTVSNEITAIEAAATEKMANGSNYVPIVTQITKNGWTPLSEGSNVYYKECSKSDTDKDIEVFANFMISGKVTVNQLATYAPTTTGGDAATTTYKSIIVNAYAVQKDGFATAQDAWGATFGQNP